MTNNANLKRAARSFMEKHAVGYSTALRAVDEPLHELRDIGRSYYGAHSFRIVPRQGSYGSGFPGVDSYDLTKNLGLSSFENPIACLKEIVRREGLLEASGTENIWAYRELWRAGLLGADAEALEPFFHHYDEWLNGPYRSLQHILGSISGIYPVNTTEFMGIRDESEKFIPVTQDQLQALGSGEPVGAIERFTQIVGAELEGWADWEDRFSILATSRAKDIYGHQSLLSVLFKGDLPSLQEELRSRDLDPLDFDFRNISELELELRAIESHLRVKHRGREVELDASLSNSLMRVLIWGRELPVRPTILEVAESIGAKFEREADGTLTRDSENKISTACPFHEDVDSFIIYPEVEPRGIFGCYSCGRNGGPERLQLEWDNPPSWDSKAYWTSTSTEAGR
jgi:hypothetical protein